MAVNENRKMNHLRTLEKSSVLFLCVIFTKNKKQTENNKIGRKTNRQKNSTKEVPT